MVEQFMCIGVCIPQGLMCVFAVIIFITLTLFGFTVYATGNVLGSPQRMYENLTYMAQVHLCFMHFILTVIASAANNDTMISSMFLMLLVLFVPVLTLGRHRPDLLGHTIKMPA